MTRIITFTGAQGTGKTTMRDKLCWHLKKKGMTIIDQYPGLETSIARHAKEMGFTINKKTDYMTQHYIAGMFMVKDLQLRKVLETTTVDYVVLDRGVLDVIPYTMLADNITSEQKLAIKNMLMFHFSMFPTRLIYCKPLDSIIADKYRSGDLAFQSKVDVEFNVVINQILDFSNPFVLEKGTVAARLKLIVKELGI